MSLFYFGCFNDGTGDCCICAQLYALEIDILKFKLQISKGNVHEFCMETNDPAFCIITQTVLVFIIIHSPILHLSHQSIKSLTKSM